MQKQKNKTVFLLVCLVMKTKRHTIFVLQNKLFKSMLIYYQFIIMIYYQILKIPIMFQLKILIDI